MLGQPNRREILAMGHSQHYDGNTHNAAVTEMLMDMTEAPCPLLLYIITVGFKFKYYTPRPKFILFHDMPHLEKLG